MSANFEKKVSDNFRGQDLHFSYSKIKTKVENMVAFKYLFSNIFYSINGYLKIQFLMFLSEIRLTQMSKLDSELVLCRTNIKQALNSRFLAKLQILKISSGIQKIKFYRHLS